MIRKSGYRFSFATNAERVWAELPDVLGGAIRYGANDSVDEVPSRAELYPKQYMADWRYQP